MASWTRALFAKKTGSYGVAPGRVGLRYEERGALDPQLHGRARAQPQARYPDRALPEPRQRHAGGSAASRLRVTGARGGLCLRDLSGGRVRETADRGGGTNDLGKVATPILSVDGTIDWQEHQSKSGTVHPEMERFAEVIGKLRGGRAERARQFFNWCVVGRVVVQDPTSLERELNNCVKLIRAEYAA